MRFAVVFDTKDQASFIPQVLKVLSEVGQATAVSSADIMEGILSDFHAVVFPGSIGSWRGLTTYGKAFADAVRGFVAAGGGLLGVCGGAYISGKEPAPALNPIYNLTLAVGDVKVKTPPPILSLEMYSFAQFHRYPVFFKFVDNPIIPGHTEIVEIAYNSGPLMHEPGETIIPIANFYQTGFTGNLGIIATKFGEGRVILCSPHPEAPWEGNVDTPCLPWLYPELARWVAEREIRVSYTVPPWERPSGWAPMSPNEGPPLPRFLDIYWPPFAPNSLTKLK